MTQLSEKGMLLDRTMLTILKKSNVDWLVGHTHVHKLQDKEGKMEKGSEKFS